MDKEILFEVDADTLLVANGGRPFSRTGVISVCASHLSDKHSGGLTDHFDDADDKQLVRAIRCNELGHYKDPNRITSDFNNEHETIHDYGGRFVWELLQNADDSMGEGRSSNVLIGSKGLGFKAVLEITDEPEIHSGPFHFLFSATRTQELLKDQELCADPPFLTFRIPHECEPHSRVRKLLAEGYSTVVRLPFRNEEKRKAAMGRLRDLDALFLLLSQELSCVRIRVPKSETVHRIKRSEPGLSNGNAKLFTRGPSGSSWSSWRRWIRNRPPPSEEDKQLTVAICLPLTEEGAAIPHTKFVSFHDFFPTEEESGSRALVHASFELEHNRKRVRKGDHDKEILQEFGELFQDVLDEIPARTALEAFGEIASTDGNSPIEKLQNRIRGTLSETPFVPVIGGDWFRPGEVQLWQGRLGFVLRDETQEVRDECLIVPELSDLKNVLKGFDAQDIEDADYIRLLRYCRNDSINECFESWRVLAKDGLRRVSSGPQWNRKERPRCLQKLREVPCWWTETGMARTLDGAKPLLFDHPEDWPDWLPVDSLHPQMQEVLKQWKSDKTIKDETSKIWKKLISGRLLKQQEEYLSNVLLPFVAKWDDDQWKTDGWRALGQVLSWSVNRKFERLAPYVETDDNPEEKRRAKAARMLRIPTDKGWLLASDCYAGKSWAGPPTFDEFFASFKDRGLVRPFQRWPNHIREGTNKDQWKALLRWAGVSWEPKVGRVSGLPSHRLVAEYKKNSVKEHYEWIWDWEIEFFPECLHSTNGSVETAEVIKRMVPLAKALKGYNALYYRTRYYYNKQQERQRVHGNFAVHQLSHEKWLPCKEALFHVGRQVAPCHAFLPEKGFRGLLPEVDRSGVGDEEWHQHISPELRELGVKGELPDNPTDWHEWMRELQGLAEQLEKNERKVPEREEKDDRLYNAACALYRGYLKLERESEFPDDIGIPCLTWEDDRKTLMFSPPDEVYHVDEPHFDEVGRDILRKGYKLFLLRLKAGKEAPERLGVRPLSEVLSAAPHRGAPEQQAGKELSQRYRERRHGLKVAASLTKPLPEEFDIIAAPGLRLQLMTAAGEPVTDVQVLSWRSEDGALLINLDKDKWRALGHGLAARVAQAEDEASLFENLLRESDKEGYLDRLRQEGVTEDDIREAGNAWSLGKSHEPGIDGDMSPVQEPPQEPAPIAGLSQRVALDSTGLQGETQPTAQPYTGGGGGAQPPITPPEMKRNTHGNGAQRPRSEMGREAEAWFYEKLKSAFDSVRRHHRDDKNRESDFVVPFGRREFHIEVKHTANRPGTLYWSGLQYEKARDLERKDVQYYIAILFPHGDEDYEIRWIWRPLDELQKELREVRWEGHSEYKLVATGSWEIETQRPDEVPTKRYEFRVKLNDRILEEFERDTEKLGALLCRLRSEESSYSRQSDNIVGNSPGSSIHVLGGSV